LQLVWVKMWKFPVKPVQLCHFKLLILLQKRKQEAL